MESEVKQPTPKFSARSQLIRYIGEDMRLGKNRPAVAAFLPDEPSEKPEEDHLSVNSLEIETMAQIAAYHRWRAQGDRGKVALCIHKVLDYTDAGKKAGIPVTYNQETASWEFREGRKVSAAYKHRPVRAVHNHPRPSPSHCGVEFARLLSDNDAAKFARRLTKRRYHLYG